VSKVFKVVFNKSLGRMVLVSKNEKNHGKKKLLQNKENQEMSSIAKTFKPLLLVSSLFLSPYVIASHPNSGAGSSSTQLNVLYDSGNKNTITLNKGGAAVKLTNLQDADLNDTSKDAVTGGQLYKTNQNVAGLEQSAVKYDDPEKKDTITLKGAKGTKLTNLQDADLTNESTDPVTGGQLYKTNQKVAGLDQSAVKYDDPRKKDTITLKGAKGTKLTNLQDGELSRKSTDAVTGGQLYKTNQKVDSLDQSAVKYDVNNKHDKKPPTITLKEGTKLTNLQDGELSRKSTDAVTGKQLFETNQKEGDLDTSITELREGQNTLNQLAVQYDSKDKDTITLGKTGTAVTLTNLQDGKLTEDSKDAVTGGQLFKTNQKVDGLDTSITELQKGQNTLSQLAVQYDVDNPNKVTLQGKDGKAVKLTNLKKGDIEKGSKDAVTGGQLFNINNKISSFLGGGAIYSNGKFTGPTYTIQNLSYNNIGDTFGAVDTEISKLRNYVDIASQIPNLREYIDTELANRLQKANEYTDDKVTGLSNSASGTGANSTQMGPNSLASGDNSTAVGTGNNVSGNSSTAVGVGNNVSGNNSGAFGDPNTVTGNGSYAVGNDNTVSGDNTFVLGNNVNTSAKNSVVLGNDSASTRDNTVSVGASGSERQIINVADATQETDAVNLRQMQAANTETLKSSKDYTDTRINSLESSFADLSSQMDRRFKEVDKRFDRQGAMSAAMMNMAASTAGLKGLNRVGVAAGFQGSEKAVAIGYQRIVNENISLSIGGAFTDNEGSGGAGVGFSW
jgi:trimeric autotransporter adhesin